MKITSPTDQIPLHWLLFGAILACVALFFGLGSWGVIDSSEARYAEISRMMYVSGDFLHPTYLGVEHYHKPPLTYYITSLGYFLFGVHPFSARFFLQLAVVTQIFLVYKIAQVLFDERHIHWLAALIYTTFLIIWIGARNLTTDAYLNTFILGSAWGMIYFVQRSKPFLLYVAAISSGLGFLTKISALLVYVGIIAIALGWLYRKRLPWTWHYIGAAISFLIVALSWFLILEMEGKPIFKYMMYDQSVVRYTTDIFKREMPFYFYFLAAPLLSIPWFFPVLEKTFKSWSSYRRDKIISFLWIWFLTPIIFFSLSHSKLILYILPAFPALALLAARSLPELEEVRLNKWFVMQVFFYFVVYLALIIYPFVLDDWKSNVYLFLGTGMAIAVQLIIIFQSSLSKLAKMVSTSLIFIFSILPLSTLFLSENETKNSTASYVAEWIREKDFHNYTILSYNRLVPSLAFHLEKPIVLLADKALRELQFESDLHWKSHYYDLREEERLEKALALVNEPTLLLVRKRRIHEVKEEILNAYSAYTDLGIWRIYHQSRND